MLPYRYLSIDTNPLIDFKYSDYDINTNQSFVYTDVGCNLLKPEIKKLFII